MYDSIFVKIPNTKVNGRITISPSKVNVLDLTIYTEEDIVKPMPVLYAMLPDATKMMFRSSLNIDAYITPMAYMSNDIMNRVESLFDLDDEEDEDIFDKIKKVYSEAGVLFEGLRNKSTKQSCWFEADVIIELVKDENIHMGDVEVYTRKGNEPEEPKDMFTDDLLEYLDIDKLVKECENLNTFDVAVKLKETINSCPEEYHDTLWKGYQNEELFKYLNKKV